MTRSSRTSTASKANRAFEGLSAALTAEDFPTEGVLGTVDQRIIQTALRLIHHSGIEQLIETWTAEDRERRGVTRPGPTPWMPPVTVVTLLVVLGLRRQPVLFTSLRDMLRDDFTIELWEAIGVEPPARGTTATALYHRVYHSYRRLIALMNPEPGSLYRVLTKDEVQEMIATRDQADCARRRDRAHEFMNAILHGTWMLIPREARRAWKGNIAIDATKVAAPARRGNSERSIYASSEPEAGWYRRDGDHAWMPDTTRAKSKYQRSKGEITWAREATTLVPYGNHPGEQDSEVPLIVLGVALDNPGKNLGANALRVVDAHLGHGRPVGTVVTDRAYMPGLKAEDFTLPMRARGYDLVMDYPATEAMRGVQASNEGAILVDGTWYCPSMPKPLQTASADYFLTEIGDPRRITDDEYRQRIAQRERYRLRNKENPDDEGVTRKMCPAAGPSATVTCPLQKQHPKAAAKTGLTKILTLNLIDPAPKVCANQSTLTFNPGIGAKCEQAHPYKSRTWQKHFTHGRQAVESVNGSIKDGRFQTIEDPDRRPRRGWIAQFLSITVMIASTNVRKIKDWMLNRQGVASVDGYRPKKRARRRDLTNGYRTAPINDPPIETAS